MADNAPQTSTIPLANMSLDRPTETEPTIVFSDQSPNLESVDGGYRAWRLLLSAFVFESLLWGFPLSFGVFQAYYSSIPTFHSSPYISVIGTTASGISYLGAPLVAPFIRRYSRYRTHMILVGWPLCILGLVAGSFANTLGGLLVTQGVMYGIGFITFYYPILSMVDEFWIRRRGMAYGLLCSASGVSGAVTPIIMQASLQRFGHRTTLRGVALALTVLTGPLIPLLKGRLQHQHVTNLRTDWTFLRKPLFWTYTASNLCMGLGFFFPALFLPSHAAIIGLSTTEGALLLALMSLAQVVGQFTFGSISDGDKVSLNVLLFLSTTIAAVATLSAWGLARSFAPLAGFSLLYGFFGAGYTAMWARMVTAVSAEPSAGQAIFGFLNFGKGVGNVIAGPMGAGLLRAASAAGAQSSYGSGVYGIVISFTGGCLLLSGVCLVGVHFKN